MSPQVLALPPGPPAMPLFGLRGRMLQYFRDNIAGMRERYQHYGPISAFVAGDPQWVFAFGPDYNQTVLTDPDTFHTSLLYLPTPPDSALEHLFSGLLCMNGETHRRHRQLLAPAFSKSHIATYRDAMVQATERMLARWTVGAIIDIAATMRSLAAEIAVTAFFGLDASPQLETTVALLHQLLRLFTSNAVNQLPYNLPGLPYRRLLRVAEQIERRLQAVLADQRSTTTTPYDLLTLLRSSEAASGMAEAERIGHLHLLFIAGHETSAMALTWTLFLLAQHPHVLTDLCDELHGLLRGAAPTVAQCEQLPLLDRVVKESLRILPPVGAFGRVSTRAFALGPYTLPTDTFVTLSPYIVHHMPELYADPELFDPGRWTALRPAAYAYFPFGAGPRTCLGAAFAQLEIKIVLALILQRYCLTVVPNTRIDRQLRVTLAPKQSLPMQVRARTHTPISVPVRGTIREMVRMPEHS